jgi:predicted metal-dependent phosphotriesterase family hydrolase
MKSFELNNKLNNAVVLTIIVAAIAVVLMPDMAFAQGQGQTLLDYTYQEYGRPMLNMAVVAVAMTMFFLRFSFPVVGMVAAGGMTLANYDTIVQLFGA